MSDTLYIFTLLAAAFYAVVALVVTVGAVDMALSWGREFRRD